MAERQNLSRREFARAAALTAAAAALPLEVIAQTEKTPTAVKPQQPPAEAGKELSTAAKAEAQQSYEALIGKYGERFTDEQKKELMRLLEQQQKSIETVRGVFLENGDEPATVLHLEDAAEKSHAAE